MLAITVLEMLFLHTYLLGATCPGTVRDKLIEKNSTQSFLVPQHIFHIVSE